MDAREERLIRNEAFFRRINERLRELGESFSLVTEFSEFVCECPDLGCTARLSLTLTEYDGVRERPGHFVLADGHERPDIEEVVERRRGWVVARKPQAELAAAGVEPG